MPEQEQIRVRIAGQEIFAGKQYDYGTVAVDEQEIIDYARVSDPLYFHVDRDAAANSHFGGIIASGPQLFSEFHKRHWIPTFGWSVIAGLAIRNWEFHKPHWPGVPILGLLTVEKVLPKFEKGVAVVFWKYFFSDPAGDSVQTAQFEVMHKLDN